MTDAEFWLLIDKIQIEGCEPDCSALEEALTELSPEELISFQDHFDRHHCGSYNWDLWGAGYIMNGGCSDDGFDYFRGWLIANGKQVFEKALADPDSLADVVQEEDYFECEELLYLACQTYEEKTGEENMPANSHSFPELGEDWDFDDDAEMRKRYPRLCEKFFDE